MPNFSERDAREIKIQDRSCKHLIAEAFEDQLGVALIRSGDSVIINEVVFRVRS